MANKKSKLWGGRFAEATSKAVEKFTSSLHFDKRLYKYDILGSIAHCQMLAKCRIIKNSEAGKIIKGLKDILKEIESGKFPFKEELEDIHMNIEKRLIEKTGSVGGKLHTARSRNDQVALDVRLFLREEIKETEIALGRLQKVIVELAEKNLDCIMPGYTHLQQAQPVLFSHHLMAYYEMLSRDNERLSLCYKQADTLPLGAGALAGTSLPIDRKYVARILKFSKVTENSLDTVSDRDFILDYLSFSSILMMHLSRLCEELILWSTSEFRFIEISDAFCTGSSMMPQKKNPDIPELIRGKTGRVYGDLMAMLTIMKSLPLSYNRDLQEDKEALFDSVDTVRNSLMVLRELIPNIKVNKDKMKQASSEGFLTATDLSDYLVNKGIPFRESHKVIGRLVRYCIENGKAFRDLSILEFKKFHKSFDKDVAEFTMVEYSVRSKKSYGGTARENVEGMIKEAKKKLKNIF